MTQGDQLHAAQAVLRGHLAELIGFSASAAAPDVEVVEERQRDGYNEQLVRYVSQDREVIPAILMLPEGDGPFPAIVAYHQHHMEWHLGKSEVAGLTGDPNQAFGPALAQHGVAVLAPDSVGFEDRRPSVVGGMRRMTDEQRYYNQMAYGLLDGNSLMNTVVGDGAQAVSALGRVEQVDGHRIGVLGHSMGGNTALFHAAVDERVRFVCASGAAATYRAKMGAGTGIEASLIIPGIRKVADFDDIAALISPRPLLLVSATEDPYSQDAEDIAEHALSAYTALGAEDALRHVRFSGGHALTKERSDLITGWVLAQAQVRGVWGTGA